MTKKTLGLDSQLYNYLVSVSLREPEILRQLREETASYPDAQMQIAPEQGQFIALLVQLLGAKKTIEVGVYTGYSSLITALNVPADGRIVACDFSEEYTAVARRYWKAAGVADKVDLRLAPALDTLNDLLSAGEAGTFDFVFIDADKEGYENYYSLSLQLVRSGGLIVVDNVLWSGKVADSQIQDEDTQALRAFNEKISHDERVSISLVPIADGLTLARKR
ncbi:MAG: SAM-dependent methyltransferase [Cyanobacteria bacterium QS_9_48_30]|nr:MAG: SAM-dependent methyltransferase [Cyanobacteria bacterium QS_9_48_30]